MKRLISWWRSRHELGGPGLREGDVGARLYGVYVDRRRGVTTLSGSYIRASAITAPMRSCADCSIPPGTHGALIAAGLADGGTSEKPSSERMLRWLRQGIAKGEVSINDVRSVLVWLKQPPPPETEDEWAARQW